mgnify:CR=1 FL=1
MNGSKALLMNSFVYAELVCIETWKSPDWHATMRFRLSCFLSESAMNRRLAMFAGLKVGLVVNQADFFLSHRLELAQALRALGAEPVLLCPPGTGEAKAAQYDLPVVTYPMSRSGINPFAEIGTILALGKLYRRLQLDLVHHITIKPVLYGTFAARRSGIPAVVNAVTGLSLIHI